MPWPSQPLPLPPTDGKLTAREWQVLCLGAMALTVLVVIAEPGIFGSTDWVRMHSLYKAYIQSSVAAGRLPLWNPHHWLGRPFLADIESAFFYPPEALYLFLDIHIACALTCAIHYLLLLYGMVKLSRALGAGRLPSFYAAFVFAASAPIVGCFGSGLVHYGQALCYAPLVLYLGVRLQAGPRVREVGLLALALGLQVLCGHPQAAWLVEIGLVVFLVGRRLARPLLPSLARLGAELGLLGAAFGLGLALAAAALLPMAELVAHGNRPAASLAFAGVFSEPAAGWATLLVPTELPHFPLPANAQLYAGLAPLLAGLAGLALLRDRNVRALLLLALGAGVLAAGEATPVFRLLYATVPGMGFLRAHSRATVLVTLPLVLAAGLFLTRAPSRRALAGVASLALAVLVLGVAFCLWWPGYGEAATGAAVRRALAALLAGVALVLYLDGAGRSAPRKRTRAVLLLGVTACDLGLAVHALKQDNQEPANLEFEQRLEAELVVAGLLAPGLPPPRLFLPAGSHENAGLWRGWSSPAGYSALAPGRVWRHMHNVLGVAPPFVINTFPSLALDAFGPFPYDSMALVVGTAPRSRQLVLRDKADPRAYVATAARPVRDDEAATALMRAGHDFHAIALVEAPLPLPSQPSAATAKATITHYAPERISVAVESPVAGLLVLAEPWFPGWSAQVNGAAAPCIPANAWMRAVPVPAGRSEVVLTFRSTYLAAGAAISLAALVVIVGLLLGPTRWREPNAPAATTARG
ncbi:MAG: YfhO family protein [Deltaproteobacteria bacterium]|nr:YfhO family protein [Deltaproteobacteria bacterium]